MARILDLGHVARLVTDEVEAAPCAVVAAAVRGGAFGIGAAGRTSVLPDAVPATVDTLFDLASLTKPVTALAMARLARAKRIRLDEPLGALLPEIAGTPSAAVPIELFAAHRAGLEAHRSLFAPLVRGEPIDPVRSLVVAARARRPDCTGSPPPEGFPALYSDLGYLLLGRALAARAGVALDALVEREVGAPLGSGVGSARQMRARDPERFARVAPTEVVPWRGGLVAGVVHDENAFALGGDASEGHAGLFGDAQAVVALGLALLDALAGASSWLGPDEVEPLVRERPGGSLRAGFDGRSGDHPTSGSQFGPRTFGHLGFTGTSLWIDPDLGLVGVLLTNRVHPLRTNDAIRRARPLVYDAIATAMRCD